MADTVRVGKRFAVVLPKKVRQRLGVREGDELIVEVNRRGLLLVPKPASYTTHLAGLHREVWKGVDVDHYLQRERRGWRR